MSKMRSLVILAAAMALSAGLFVGLQGLQAQDVPAAAPPALAGTMPTSDVPFFADWASSPHASRKAEAFTHWDAEGVVPIPCARCHTTPGFRDYIGADGTPPGVLDHPAATGTVINCTACHNARTLAMSTVTFPSGQSVNGLRSADARCMTCHQGVESASTVSRVTEGQGDDAINPRLAFINVHYRAAGATLMGTLAHGAFEYPGKTYNGQLKHVAPYNACSGCHDVHTTAVKFADCSACHKEVTNKASLHLIRAKPADHDGNGNDADGIGQEVDQLRIKLITTIQAYAKTVSGKNIAYNADAYPYFFVDTNGNGIADPDEAKAPNRFNAWTPRLLKAAYNFQFVLKDPGSFAHNPAYTLQILYDSVADLGTKVPADMSKAKRP